MSDLSSATPEQLRAELERRDRAAAIPPPAARPLAEIDWRVVYETATSAVNDAVKRQFMDDDSEGYVWEAVLSAIYGKDYWTWREAQGW